MSRPQRTQRRPKKQHDLTSSQQSLFDKVSEIYTTWAENEILDFCALAHWDNSELEEALANRMEENPAHLVESEEWHEVRKKPQRKEDERPRRGGKGGRGSRGRGSGRGRGEGRGAGRGEGRGEGEDLRPPRQGNDDAPEGTEGDSQAPQNGHGGAPTLRGGRGRGRAADRRPRSRFPESNKFDEPAAHVEDPAPATRPNPFDGKPSYAASLGRAAKKPAPVAVPVAAETSELPAPAPAQSAESVVADGVSSPQVSGSQQKSRTSRTGGGRVWQRKATGKDANGETGDAKATQKPTSPESPQQHPGSPQQPQEQAPQPSAEPEPPQEPIPQPKQETPKKTPRSPHYSPKAEAAPTPVNKPRTLVSDLLSAQNAVMLPPGVTASSNFAIRFGSFGISSPKKGATPVSTPTVAPVSAPSDSSSEMQSSYDGGFAGSVAASVLNLTSPELAQAPPSPSPLSNQVSSPQLAETQPSTQSLDQKNLGSAPLLPAADQSRPSPAKIVAGGKVDQPQPSQNYSPYQYSQPVHQTGVVDPSYRVPAGFPDMGAYANPQNSSPAHQYDMHYQYDYSQFGMQQVPYAWDPAARKTSTNTNRNRGGPNNYQNNRARGNSKGQKSSDSAPKSEGGSQGQPNKKFPTTAVQSQSPVPSQPQPSQQAQQPAQPQQQPQTQPNQHQPQQPQPQQPSPAQQYSINNPYATPNHQRGGQHNPYKPTQFGQSGNFTQSHFAQPGSFKQGGQERNPNYKQNFNKQQQHQQQQGMHQQPGYPPMNAPVAYGPGYVYPYMPPGGYYQPPAQYPPGFSSPPGGPYGYHAPSGGHPGYGPHPGYQEYGDYGDFARYGGPEGGNPMGAPGTQTGGGDEHTLQEGLPSGYEGASWQSNGTQGKPAKGAKSPNQSPASSPPTKPATGGPKPSKLPTTQGQVHPFTGQQQQPPYQSFPGHTAQPHMMHGINSYPPTERPPNPASYQTWMANS